MFLGNAPNNYWQFYSVTMITFWSRTVRLRCRVRKHFLENIYILQWIKYLQHLRFLESLAYRLFNTWSNSGLKAEITSTRNGFEKSSLQQTYFKAVNIVVKGNIAQTEQYFLWQNLSSISFDNYVFSFKVYHNFIFEDYFWLFLICEKLSANIKWLRVLKLNIPKHNRHIPRDIF